MSNIDPCDINLPLEKSPGQRQAEEQINDTFEGLDLEDMLNLTLEVWPRASLRVEPSGEITVITGAKTDEDGRVVSHIDTKPSDAYAGPFTLEQHARDQQECKACNDSFARGAGRLCPACDAIMEARWAGE